MVLEFQFFYYPSL